MSLSLFQKNRPPSDIAEVPDIDVTPVMNMFVILIPFLVSMAVFTHVSIIDFGLPPNVGSNLDSSQGKPKLKLTILVTNQYLGVTLGEQMLDSIPRTSEAFPLQELRNRLAARRPTLEIQDEAIVSVADRVKFKHVVNVMDLCRESGFEKVGLSSSGDMDPSGGRP